MTNTTPTNIEKLSAKALRAIPLDEPERLFQTPDLKAILSDFRKLAHIWYPRDAEGKDTDGVFNHITNLRAAAERKLADGTWTKPGQIVFNDIEDGKTYRLTYLKKHPFELGETIVAKTHIAFRVGLENRDLFQEAVATIQNLKYSTDIQRKTIKPFMPEIVKTIKLADAYVLVVKKEPQEILLRDLLDYCGGTLAPQHTAWVLSRLHNLACYLSAAKIAHNDLSLETLTVDPAAHTVALRGGWWYARPLGMPLLAVPERTLAEASPVYFEKGRASASVDLELIRAVGRELLGDLTKAPGPLALWLKMPVGDTAVQDYKNWDALLNGRLADPRHLGPRRFQELAVRADDVYAPPQAEEDTMYHLVMSAKERTARATGASRRS